jgi:UDPglucose 6-dehydrogenase
MDFYFNCVGYDIVGDHEWKEVLQTSIVFVCVSTPETGDGRLDCSAVDEVLRRLSSSDYKGLVAIKSTIGVGFMDNATNTYPSLRIVYMPEFLREKSNFTWFVNPDRLVISGEENDVQEALSYFHWVENAKILVMDHRSAEIGKLAHNAYIATKVSFTNEIERICEELGADPEHVMSTIWADRRVMSKEHLKPYLGPYRGKCVPKDTRELMNSASKAILLRAVDAVNESAKAEPSGKRRSSPRLKSSQ